MLGAVVRVWVWRVAENISSVLAFQKNHHTAVLRSVPHTHSLPSQLPGDGREQMERDLLQSPIKSMTKL